MTMATQLKSSFLWVIGFFLSLFSLQVSAVAADYKTEATCQEAGFHWKTDTCYDSLSAVGSAVTMKLHNAQSISVVPLTKEATKAGVTTGSDKYYISDLTDGEVPAAWGVKTNGRFSMRIENDFGSIMDDKGTEATTDDVPLFGTNPTIKDDFGTTVTWPAFVKWETRADGSFYNSANEERYEVLPATFDIDILNIDSHSGSAPTGEDTVDKAGFTGVWWTGSGKDVIGYDAASTNKFTDKIGSIQVADQLGASGTDGVADTITYSWTEEPTGEPAGSARFADHFVAVIALPEMDGAAAANAQAGTYYAAIKLTVTAEEI